MPAKTIQNQSGIIFFIAIIIGLLFPQQTEFLNDYAITFLSIALFVIFLGADFSKIWSYVKKPDLLAYIIIAFLIIIPAIIYFVARIINPVYAIGFLLVFGVPTATTSPVVVKLFKGNVPLGIAIEFFLYIVSPVTLPLLALYLAGNVISISTDRLFLTLVETLVLPMALAYVAKKVMDTKKLEEHSSPITILLLALAALGVIGKQAEFILANLSKVLFFIVIFYGLYIIINIAGNYIAFWLNKEDRLTIAISKTYMNGTLALVLASQFFGPEAVLVAVSNFIVWYLYLGVSKQLLKSSD